MDTVLDFNLENFKAHANIISPKAYLAKTVVKFFRINVFVDWKYEAYSINVPYEPVIAFEMLQQVISNVEKSNNIIGAQWKISGYDEETLIIAFSINFDPSDHYILVRAESIEC